MHRAASIARMSAVAVSLVYMMVLLPHFGGIGPKHLSSFWFVAGMLIAFSWIPLFMFRNYLAEGGGILRSVLSFAPLVFIAAFFTALFAVAR